MSSASISGRATKARFAQQGTEVFLLQPKEFEAYVRADAERLTDLIKTANIKGE
jgi:tripartite-type tricarboxylate transporter receptor subunit TctC